MKFTIKRTSVYIDDEKPCEEAKEETFEYWTVTSATEEEIRRRWKRPWRGQGTDHKEYKNANGETLRMRKEGEQTQWVIELNTLEDLIAFGEKYGDLIISKERLGDPSKHEYISTIEIYDDYRE